MSLKVDRLQLEIIINNDQARKSLRLLDDEIRTIKRQMGKQKEGTAEYERLNALLKTKMQQHDKIIESLGIEKLTIRELQQRYKELAMIKKNLDPTTTAWKKLDTQMNAINDRIKTLNGSAAQTGMSLSKTAQLFNKYFTMVTSVIAVITGVVFSVKEWVKGLVGLDDAIANVMKTTNMTRGEVRGLYTDFANLNTRTARMELLKLAEEAGRLGKRGRKDVMDFVEVGNMIQVALGDELKGNASEAIKEVGKLTTIYQVGAKYGVDYKQSMLMVGSAINEVSANSLASAPFLIEMLKRMGGIADQADISAQSVIGYGAALDILGQTEEVSGTALNKAILNMFTDTATYAEIAKMEVNDFRTLLQTDANAAFLQFLKGLNGNNEGLTVMAAKFDNLGLDGARAVQVLASLASNTGLVEEQQNMANKALVQGISLTNEYNIKNNNMAGNLEKIGRALHAFFVNSKLNASLESIVSIFAKWVKVPVEKALIDEGNQVAVLIGKLTDVNTKVGERLKLLNELKEISPDIVKGLDAEKLNYDLLTKNVKAYNEELLNRIMLSKLSDEQQEILSKAGEAYAGSIKTQADMMALIMQLNPDIASSAGTLEEKFKKTKEYMLSLSDVVPVLFSGWLSDNDKLVTNQDKYNQLLFLNIKNNDLLTQQNEYKADADILGKQIEYAKELLGINKENAVVTSDTNKTTTVTKTPETPEEKKARLEAEKLSYESEKKAIESRIALMAEGYAKELAQLRQSYKEKRDAIKQELAENEKLTSTDRSNLNTTLGNYSSQQKIDEQKLKDGYLLKELQFQKQLTDLKLSYVEKGSEAEFALKQQQIDQQQAIEIAELKGTEEEKSQLKLEIIKKFEDQKKDLINSRSQGLLDKELTQNLTALINANAAELDTLNQKFKDGKISEQNYNDEIKRIKERFAYDSLMLAIGKAEKELEILKLSGADTVQAEKDLAQMRLDAQEQFAKSTSTDSKTDRGKITDKDIANAAIDTAQNVADSLFQIGADRRSAELDAELSKLDQQRDHELSNKNLTEKQKDAINRKYAAKEAELKRQAWERDKKAAINQAWINGALAITKTFAAYGFTPAGWLAAAAQAVATGLQIAVIAKQQAPQFAEGNYQDILAGDGRTYRATITNSKHQSGLFNKPTFVPGFGLFGETVQPELVFNPKDTTAIMNSPGLINAINHTLGGGSRQFANGTYKQLVDEMRYSLHGVDTTSTLKDPRMIGLMEKIEAHLAQPKEPNVAYLVSNEEYLRKHNEANDKYQKFKNKK